MVVRAHKEQHSLKMQLIFSPKLAIYVLTI